MGSIDLSEVRGCAEYRRRDNERSALPVGDQSRLVYFAVGNCRTDFAVCFAHAGWIFRSIYEHPQMLYR